MSSYTSKYKSTPTFTFKGRTKSVTTFNDPSFLPSPQLYNPQKISVMKKMPSIKFPLSNRKQWAEIKSKEMLPGPGSHQIKQYTTDGLKKSISKTIFKHRYAQTPCPGQYNPDSIKLKKKQPSFTMQHKTISMHDMIIDKNQYTPSPGKYQQPILKFRSASSISIGRAKRKSFANLQKIPGPGSYQMEKSYTSSISSSSKCKLGKALRKIDFAVGEKSPGPGSYQKKNFIQENQKKQRGYSCRGKFQQIPSTKTPGPGQYQTPILNHKFKSSPSIRMVKSVRYDFIDKSLRSFGDNPGPGSFQIDDGHKMKFKSVSASKFPKSKVNYLTQSFKSQVSEKLGPGTYNANDSFLKKNQPKFSISLNRDRGLYKKIPDMPGPGQYNPKTQLLHQSQFTHKLQTSQRTNTIKHLLQLPGPGQYQFSITQRLGRNFKFSKDKRQNIIQAKIKKQIASTHHTFQERQQFPNPPKYMCVQPKMKINQKNIKKYT